MGRREAQWGLVLYAFLAVCSSQAAKKHRRVGNSDPISGTKSSNGASQQHPYQDSDGVASHGAAARTGSCLPTPLKQQLGDVVYYRKLQLTPDGLWFISGHANSPHIVKLSGEGLTFPAIDFALSASGNYFASLSPKKILTIHNATSGEKISAEYPSRSFRWDTQKDQLYFIDQSQPANPVLSVWSATGTERQTQISPELEIVDQTANGEELLLERTANDGAHSLYRFSTKNRSISLQKLRGTFRQFRLGPGANTLLALTRHPYQPTRLVSIDEKGTVRALSTGRIEWEARNFAVSRDRSTVAVFSASRAGGARLQAIELRPTGGFGKFWFDHALPRAEIHSIAVDKSRLYFVTSSSEKSDEIRLVQAGTPSADTAKSASYERPASCPADLRSVQLQAADGLNFQSWLYAPANRTAKRSIASQTLGSAILAHDSPGGSCGLGFSSEIEYLVLSGVPVLCPNFRGSEGFGEKFASLGVGAHFADIGNDLLAATEWSRKNYEFAPTFLYTRGNTASVPLPTPNALAAVFSAKAASDVAWWPTEGFQRLPAAKAFYVFLLEAEEKRKKGP